MTILILEDKITKEIIKITPKYNNKMIIQLPKNMRNYEFIDMLINYKLTKIIE